ARPLARLARPKVLQLASLEILVLDEADRMLDMGFIRDIRRILALAPHKRQNIFLSATSCRQMVDRLVRRPFIKTPVRNSTLNGRAPR
ncbi:MAG: DEAD/DEAH box helicase, partial [Bacteroidia bacterium]|nr:DEAD/DEAH box helicase [Bacteroidia bacterium]